MDAVLELMIGIGFIAVVSVTGAGVQWILVQIKERLTARKADSSDHAKAQSLAKDQSGEDLRQERRDRVVDDEASRRAAVSDLVDEGFDSTVLND